jgi:hypothetical protein
MSGVLVDTCIWFLALRGNTPRETAVAEQLTQLIDENRVKIIGPIRQELLSGYTHKSSFDKLRQKLNYFPNEQVLDSDYECAAPVKTNEPVEIYTQLSLRITVIFRPFIHTAPDEFQLLT